MTLCSLASVRPTCRASVARAPPKSKQSNCQDPMSCGRNNPSTSLADIFATEICLIQGNCSHDPGIIHEPSLRLLRDRYRQQQHRVGCLRDILVRNGSRAYQLNSPITGRTDLSENVADTDQLQQYRVIQASSSSPKEQFIYNLSVAPALRR